MPEPLDYAIVIVGAGPAGITAACAAAESAKRVLVIDNMPAPGGNIWRGTGTPGHPRPALFEQWSARLQRLATPPKFLFGTTVFAAPAAHTLTAESPTGTFDIHWQKLILATGARELFLPFPGWTLPNVFGVGGLQALAKGGWPVAGKNIVISGTGPLLLACAAQLKLAGAKILLIAEQAPLAALAQFALSLPALAPGKIFQAIGLKRHLLGVPFKTSTWVTAAHGTSQLHSVTLTNEEKSWDLPCDFLACSYNLIPNLELAQLLGCHITANTVQVDDHLRTTVPAVFCAGEPNGIGGIDTSLLEGQIAGHAAAAALDGPQSRAASRAQKLAQRLPRANRFRQALKTAFMLRPELLKLAQADTLVCRCEDVTHAQLLPHPNFRSAKLHTRCGMGACQGRVCGAAVRTLFNWESASVRPPVLPVSVNALSKAP